MTEKPNTGQVVNYPYLWARQANDGETEGRKPRPCAVVLALKTQSGLTEMRLCAITSQKPKSGTIGLQVPDTEKRRAGLEASVPLWVIVDEHNVDIYERSYYFAPDSTLGTFSSKFTKELQSLMISTIQAHISQYVKRSD
jgi:hypothetical protein